MWPKHPDGRNKKVGEMTEAERRSMFAASAQRVAAEFKRPEVQTGIAAALASDPRKPN